MFGVREFDVIVGNPPYIDSQVMVKTMEPYRNQLRQHYDSATGNWDLFVVFLEKSMQLLRPNGVMSMIVKNQLIGANYATQIRRILSANTVDMILDYSEVNVFKSASVYPVIIQVTKNKKHHPVNIEIFSEGFDNPQIISIPTEKFYSQDVWGSFFASNQTQDLEIYLPENPLYYENLVDFQLKYKLNEIHRILSVFDCKDDDDVEIYFEDDIIKKLKYSEIKNPSF
jgi:hypothetical protein